jgi:hypothetical protein
LTRRKEQKSHPRAGHGGTLLGRSLSIYLALIASTSRRSHFPLFRTLFLRTLPRDDAVPVVVCAQMGTRNDRQANREKYFQSQKLTNAEDGDTHLHFFFFWTRPSVPCGVLGDPLSFTFCRWSVGGEPGAFALPLFVHTHLLCVLGSRSVELSLFLIIVMDIYTLSVK